MRRSLLVAGLVLASMTSFGPSARGDDAPLPPAVQVSSSAHADDPKLPPVVEAARRDLVEAYLSAKHVLRAYRVELPDKPPATVEVFRAGDRQGIRVGMEADTFLMASDGATLCVVTPKGGIQVDVGGRSMAAAQKRFRLCVRWLAALWEITLPEDHWDEPMLPGFTLGVAPGDEGKPKFSAAIEWGNGSPLSWLKPAALLGAEIAGPDPAGLIVAKGKGVESAFHREDGFIARSRSVGAADGRAWSIVEIPPTRTAEFWEDAIRAVCSTPVEGQEAWRFKEAVRALILPMALEWLRRAAPDLPSRPDRLAIAAAVLARTAFLDRDLEEAYAAQIDPVRSKASQSYVEYWNQNVGKPGVTPLKLEEFAKAARDDLLQRWTKDAQHSIDLVGAKIPSAVWPPADAAAICAALSMAARTVLAEHLDARWPLK